MDLVSSGVSSASQARFGRKVDDVQNSGFEWWHKGSIDRRPARSKVKHLRRRPGQPCLGCAPEPALFSSRREGDSSTQNDEGSFAPLTAPRRPLKVASSCLGKFYYLKRTSANGSSGSIASWNALSDNLSSLEPAVLVVACPPDQLWSCKDH